MTDEILKKILDLKEKIENLESHLKHVEGVLNQEENNFELIVRTPKANVYINPDTLGYTPEKFLLHYSSKLIVLLNNLRYEYAQY